jgi:hypothetical protein
MRTKSLGRSRKRKSGSRFNWVNPEFKFRVVFRDELKLGARLLGITAEHVADDAGDFAGFCIVFFKRKQHTQLLNLIRVEQRARGPSPTRQ